MGSKKTRPFSDILTDPKNGIDVWCRWLWDGGKAYVVDHRDAHHNCPVCEGAGRYTVLLDGHAPMTVQPEREDSCATCSGTGEVEALYGIDEDGASKLLWPLDAEDAERGCDDL